MKELVLLDWFDSTVAAATEVYTDEDAASIKIFVMKSVGWLIGEADEPHGGYYLLAATQHGEKDWRGVLLIPKVNVVNKGVLEEKP